MCAAVSVYCDEGEGGVRCLHRHGGAGRRLDGRHGPGQLVALPPTSSPGLLLSSGAHPRVVMELLGHSQMRTTTDTYSHVMPSLAREEAERMGDALCG